MVAGAHHSFYIGTSQLPGLKTMGTAKDGPCPTGSTSEVTKSLHTVESRIVAALQSGLPRTRTPFDEVAHQVGISTDELLAILDRWIADGTIRRFGAVVDHFQVGWGEGAMVVWKVPSDRVAQVGAILAGFAAVSHAYERQTAPGWEYNLYTMVHEATAAAVRRTADRMSQATGMTEYQILSTIRELKKTPPRYVP
jgi:DNA-binding Lrp family transcriptional regulator